MRRFHSPALLLGSVCLLAACERDDDTLTPADVAAIHAAEQQFATAVVAGDVDRILAGRTDDVVWMPPNTPVVQGKDAVRASLATWPATTRFALTSATVEGNGDLAYNRGTYVWSGVIGGDTTTDHGKYVEVLRRQPGDRWLIAVDIWNSDQPAAPGPASARPRR